MGLVLRRDVGQSIEIFSPVDESLGVVKVTFRGHGAIEIDAPKYLVVMRSELLDDGTIKPVNKYWLLGPNPLAAIASIGFTREMTGFARGIHQHETLALDIQHDGSQRGWVCGVIGERAKHRCESLESLKDYVLGVALCELKKRGAK